MNTIFVSFNDEGWFCLKRILEMKGNVVGIFTLKDDLRLKMSGNKAFDDLASEYDIPLHKIRNINDEGTLSILNELNPDISFVIGWSQLVRSYFLSLTEYGCIGIHPTMLPKHRGRAPLPWAIIFGLRKTGVSMFYIKEGADNGDIIGQVEVQITKEDDAGSLYQKVLQAHEELIDKYFPLIMANNAPRLAQDESRSSQWPARAPRDGIIDWNTCSHNLYDWIRALTEPYPGAFTFFREKKLKIWKSTVITREDGLYHNGEIVEIDSEGIVVKAGEGLIKLTCVQFEGNDKLEGKEIFEANIFRKGEQLG
jgi:methionyl-tRNA formyltransferase